MSDLRAAVRSLRGTPLPSLVVLVTLALAIAANTAVFSVVSGVLLRPLGYGDDDELVVPWTTHGPRGGAEFRLSPGDYRDLRQEADSFGGQVALYRNIGSTLTGLDRPVRVGSLTVTPGLFSVLDVSPAAGRFFSERDGRPEAADRTVITHDAWVRHYGGDPELVGSTIQLDGVPHTVIGVTPEGFQFPPGDDEVDVYFPMTITDAVLLDRDHRMFDAVARLRDGVSLAVAREEMAAIAARLAREYPDSNAGWSLTARSLRDEVVGDLRPMLAVLSGAVLLVLLTACATIANLLLARSVAARRELAVRAALGAARLDLFRRAAAESLILGGFGGAAGVLLAGWGTAMLRAALPASIPRGGEIGLDGTVLLFAVAITAGATVLFGAIPALRAMSPDLAGLLAAGASTGSDTVAGRRWREAIVVLEVALAVVLLVGAGLMVRSFDRLGRVDPGFRRDGVVAVAVQLPDSRYDRSEFRPFFTSLLERVRALPGVTGAGAASDLPMSRVGLDFELEFTVSGLEAVDPTARPSGDFRLVLPGYFDAMGMEILRGRRLTSLDTTERAGVAIVNRTLVDRYFPDVDPLGRSLSAAMLGDLQVVGVVADVRHDGLRAEYGPEVYVPYGRVSTAEMHVVVRSDLETAVIAGAVGDILANLDPELTPSQVASMAALLRESVAVPRFNTTLLVGLGLCAALLAMAGVYGIVAYTVARRTAEIGIRMALGADARATVQTVVGRGLAVVLAGVGAGIVAALGLTPFLDGLLYATEPAEPATFAAVAVVALLVGGIAAWIPARRATRVDPVRALREDGVTSGR